MVFITIILHRSSVPHVSPSHLLLLYLQNSLLLPCTSPDRFNSISALAFLILYLQDWKAILDSSWVNFLLPFKSNNYLDFPTMANKGNNTRAVYQKIRGVCFMNLPCNNCQTLKSHEESLFPRQRNVL